MYHGRKAKIRALRAEIEARERKIRGVEDECKTLAREIHAKCPLCRGSNSVRCSGGYDSSTSYEPCPYPVKWLLGEADPPENWRKQIPSWVRC